MQYRAPGFSGSTFTDDTSGSYPITWTSSGTTDAPVYVLQELINSIQHLEHMVRNKDGELMAFGIENRKLKQKIEDIEADGVDSEKIEKILHRFKVIQKHRVVERLKGITDLDSLWEYISELERDKR
jgi:hypothetical protein